MKGKTIKRLSASIALAAIAAALTVAPVFANSAVQYEDGVTAQGVTVAHERSVLEVKSEKLYFDIDDFPKYDEPQNYNATVTAEYELYNPTADTVRATLAFPAGSKPTYFDDMSDFKSYVTLGGNEVEATLRHTLNSFTHYKNKLATLCDGFYTDGFFSPDLPVTEYKITLDCSQLTEEEKDGIYSVEYFADLSVDKSKTRYISNSASDSVTGYFFNGEGDAALNKDGNVIYALGEDVTPSLNFDIKVFAATGYDAGYDYINIGIEECDLPVKLNIEKSREITLKELLLTNRPAESTVSETDWFNGAISSFSKTSVSPVTVYGLKYLEEQDFDIWYVYSIEVAAGATVVNSVKTPIFPNYSGSLYFYSYLLSPANDWAKFGTLEIIIRTELELRDCSFEFDTVPGGYRGYFDSLPDGELEFSLYKKGSGIGISYDINESAILKIFADLIIAGSFVSAAISLAGVIVAIVFLVKNRNKDGGDN